VMARIDSAFYTENIHGIDNFGHLQEVGRTYGKS